MTPARVGQLPFFHRGMSLRRTHTSLLQGEYNAFFGVQYLPIDAKIFSVFFFGSATTPHTEDSGN